MMRKALLLGLAAGAAALPATTGSANDALQAAQVLKGDHPSHGHPSHHPSHAQLQKQKQTSSSGKDDSSPFIDISPPPPSVPPSTPPSPPASPGTGCEALPQYCFGDSSARPSCTPEGQDRYQYGDASDPGVPCCEGLFENKYASWLPRLWG